MATYRDIADWIKANYGFAAQTCWIADVKASHGLTTRIASNRTTSSNRAKPCPDSKRDAIEAALVHFGMLS